MEEGVDKKNMTRMKEQMRKKCEITDSVSTTVNNEKFGGNVDLEDFYDIYDDFDENITEDYIVWVNTNKTIW